MTELDFVLDRSGSMARPVSAGYGPAGFLCVRIQLSVQKEKSERISHLEDTVRLSLFVKEQYS